MKVFRLLLYFICVVGCSGEEQQPPSEPTEQEVHPEKPPEPPAPKEEAVEYTIKRGDTLGKILPKFNISTNKVHKASLEVYDLSKIRAGKVLTFIQREGEEKPIAIKYPLDSDNTIIVERNGEQWVARKDVVQYTEKNGYRTLTIENSLWVAASKAGLHATDIANIIQIFEYDIDFNTEVRSGDSAKMIVPELYIGEEMKKLGAPSIMEFTSQGQTYLAIRYTNKAGETDYYDAEGISRKGAFLRSPLAFSRVTSKFNPKRFHPILKKTRPHNGTDFGAKTGTPVRSVADGVVTKVVRSNRGHGNFIKIKHDPPYQTSYSHLSKILVKKGQKVKQGKVIGKVGSTGFSTGPHLHYQMWKRGKFVDAMKEKLPKNKSLPKSEKGDFKKHRDKLIADLERMSKAQQ